MSTVYLGVGTNQGDRETNVKKALEFVAEIPDTEILQRSTFKEYEAQEASQGQSAFLNGVVEITTDLQPLELLHKLQVIERKMGRATKGDGADRPIDLDILSIEPGIIIEGKSLVVPHPRLHSRRFVLEPLSEVSPSWQHPKFGKTSQELLNQLNFPDENNQIDTSSAVNSQSS